MHYALPSLARVGSPGPPPQPEHRFTVRNIPRQDGRSLFLSMSTTTLLEAAAGFLTATTAFWFVVNAPRQGVPAAAAAPVVSPRR